MRRFLILNIFILCISFLNLLNPKIIYSQQATRFESALSYIEIYEGGGHNYIPSGRHLVTIDYKSKLKIVPDKTAIKKISVVSQDVLPSLSQSIIERIKALGDLVKAGQEYVDNVSKVLEEVETARSLNDTLSQNQIYILKKRIIEQGKQGLDLVELLDNAAEAKIRSLYGDNEAAYDEAYAELTDSFIQDEKGNDVTLNVNAFAKFLTGEINYLGNMIREDVEIAQTHGSTRFRMRAWLQKPDKKPFAVSVLNYHEIDGLEGPKRPRIAFRMSLRDQQRMEKNFEIAKNASTLIREVQNKKSSLNDAMGQFQRKVRVELKELSSLSQYAIKIQKETINKIKNSISNVITKVNDEQIERLEELENFLSNFENDLNIIKEEFSKLTDAANSTDNKSLIQIFQNVLEGLNKALEIVIDYPSKINRNIQNLGILLEILGDQISTEVEAAINETKREFEELINLKIDKYAKAAQNISGLLGLSQMNEIIDEFDTSDVDPGDQSFDLENILTGIIDLDDTAADRGDKILVKVELFTTETSGKETIIQTAVQKFKVERLGFTDSFSSQVIFVDRRGSGNNGYTDKKFTPAPSASWTIHYQFRKTPESNSIIKSLHFINIGLGINTAALNFENETFQIGLGIHTTLFNDLLIGGYGYNLNVEKDNWYGFIGIGIIEGLESIGGALFKVTNKFRN